MLLVPRMYERESQVGLLAKALSYMSRCLDLKHFESKVNDDLECQMEQIIQKRILNERNQPQNEKILLEVLEEKLHQRMKRIRPYVGNRLYECYLLLAR